MPRKNFKTLSTEVRKDSTRAARVDAYKDAIHDSLGLGEMRERRGKTQTAVAKAFGASQARVSSLERQDDVYLSTLSGYVAALGGSLEVRAVFEDETIELVSHESSEGVA